MLSASQSAMNYGCATKLSNIVVAVDSYLLRDKMMTCFASNILLPEGMSANSACLSDKKPKRLQVASNGVASGGVR